MEAIKALAVTLKEAVSTPPLREPLSCQYDNLPRFEAFPIDVTPPTKGPLLHKYLTASANFSRAYDRYQRGIDLFHWKQAARVVYGRQILEKIYYNTHKLSDAILQLEELNQETYLPIYTTGFKIMEHVTVFDTTMKTGEDMAVKSFYKNTRSSATFCKEKTKGSTEKEFETALISMVGDVSRVYTARIEIWQSLLPEYESNYIWFMKKFEQLQSLQEELISICEKC